MQIERKCSFSEMKLLYKFYVCRCKCHFIVLAKRQVFTFGVVTYFLIIYIVMYTHLYAYKI